MKVEVKPLPQKKWHGKKDGESFAQPKVIEALYDEATNGYATGLTEEEAKEYGKRLGVDLSNTYHPEDAHSFWASKAAWVYLPNHTLILDDTKPLDFVKIKLLKASNKVANSMKDYEEGKFPDATHVIFDEKEEVALRASKIAQKNKAIGYLGKMTLEDKANIVMVLSQKSVKGQSPDFVDVEIDEIITNRVEEFLGLVEMGAPEVRIRSNVHEMIYKNIITKEGHSYFYMGELIGMDFNEVVSFFKDPNNQKMKVLMMDRLEKK